MKIRFTNSFKIQAVEKALNRDDATTLRDIARSLNVGCSTLSRWIVEARNHEFDTLSADKINAMTQDKRPQDWTLEERFTLVVACSSLSDEALSEHCRKQGVYPHHVNQWKRDFVKGDVQSTPPVSFSELKTLKHENKALKKELNRKEKALAETAALLVLQKKVNEIWGRNEDSSP